MPFDEQNTPTRTEVTKEVQFSPNYTNLYKYFPISSMKPIGINRIGFTYNIRPESSTPSSDSVALEYDELETIEAIHSALSSAGYEVELMPLDLDFAQHFKSKTVDFVFNIAEGLRGESRESHIPAFLEMHGVPYSGSGVLTQALTLSKSRTKEILVYYKIPTPKYQLFRTGREKLKSNLAFPLIVKPDSQGSSAGIINDSVVHTQSAMYTQIERVIHEFGSPVLVEQFLPGREFTVGILGNDPAITLPIIEVNFDHLPPEFAKIDSYESKWTYDVPGVNANPLKCPADIPIKLQNQIVKIALKTYKALNCFDFCRIDVRVDHLGQPHVLELNALPGLNPNPEIHSRFPLACEVAGLSYNDMILTILNIALKRNRLIP
ncbi:MAG: D-alanine--D-alanine ligase [Promethearchaeota archaeon]|nr:MAG: D-alanine--D-alanine ligase [Candidatus Lokiarchaeota archaeon]